MRATVFVAPASQPAFDGATTTVMPARGRRYNFFTFSGRARRMFVNASPLCGYGKTKTNMLVVTAAVRPGAPRPLPAAFPEGFQPWPFEAGVQSASATISVKAVSTAFFVRPAGVYAGVTDRLIFDG